MSNPWTISHRAHLPARLLADRHYNRQKPGSPGFVPPGRCVVLLLESEDAVWVTSWPYAQYVKHARAGAWVNSLFRNESPHLSSWLVQQAILKTLEVWPDPPAQGLITFVDAGKIRRKRDPGRCYRKAGFTHVGFTKGGLYALQLLPDEIKKLGGTAVAEFKGFKISEKITEFGDSVPTTWVSEGNYLLELVDIVGGMTRDDGEPFVSFRTRIAAGPIGRDPEGAGLPIWSRNSFGEKTEWSAGSMFNAVGIDPRGLVNMEFGDGDAGFAKFQQVMQMLAAKVKGRKFGCSLVDYDGGRTKTSQIRNPFPASEYEQQAKIAATQPVAAPRPARQAQAAPAAAQPTVSDDDIAASLNALVKPAEPATV